MQPLPSLSQLGHAARSPAAGPQVPRSGPIADALRGARSRRGCRRVAVRRPGRRVDAGRRRAGGRRAVRRMAETTPRSRPVEPRPRLRPSPVSRRRRRTRTLVVISASSAIDSAEIVRRLKEATVYIKNKVAGKTLASGTGFVIEVRGDTVHSGDQSARRGARPFRSAPKPRSQRERSRSSKPSSAAARAPRTSKPFPPRSSPPTRPTISAPTWRFCLSKV